MQPTPRLGDIPPTVTTSLRQMSRSGRMTPIDPPTTLPTVVEEPNTASQAASQAASVKTAVVTKRTVTSASSSPSGSSFTNGSYSTASGSRSRSGSGTSSSYTGSSYTGSSYTGSSYTTATGSSERLLQYLDVCLLEHLLLITLLISQVGSCITPVPWLMHDCCGIRCWSHCSWLK